MLRPLSVAQHTLFAGLLEQGVVDLFDAHFPENGSFNQIGLVRLAGVPPLNRGLPELPTFGAQVVRAGASPFASSGSQIRVS